MSGGGSPNSTYYFRGPYIRGIIISRGLNWGPLFRETTICQNNVRFLE